MTGRPVLDATLARDAAQQREAAALGLPLPGAGLDTVIESYRAALDAERARTAAALDALRRVSVALDALAEVTLAPDTETAIFIALDVLRRHRPRPAVPRRRSRSYLTTGAAGAKEISVWTIERIRTAARYHDGLQIIAVVDVGGRTVDARVGVPDSEINTAKKIGAGCAMRLGDVWWGDGSLAGIDPSAYDAAEDSDDGADRLLAHLRGPLLAHWDHDDGPDGVFDPDYGG